MPNDAHTRIFHELLEPLLRIQLNGTQFRVFLWVARNSYGRMGEQFTAYTWGGIARAINADRVRVSREGRALLEMGVLQLGTESEIGINKHRVMELGGCKNARGDAKTHPCELATPSVSKTHPLSYKKERRKETDALDSKDVKASPPASAPPPSPAFGPTELMALWNSRAAAIMGRALKLTPERSRAAGARLKEEPGREKWESIIDRINASPFCCGKNDRGWRADFDWLLRPGTPVKVLEGKYDARNGGQHDHASNIYD